MSVLPPLPQDGSPTPDSLHLAYQQLSEVTSGASNILEQDADTHRIRYHIDRLTTTVVLILEALSEVVETTLLEEWLSAVYDYVLDLTVRLQHAYSEASNRSDENVRFWNPITIVNSGRRGRPRKVIDPDFLRYVTHPSYKRNLEELCATLGISSQHFRNECERHGIRHHKYSDISDDELDTIVQNYIIQHPMQGRRYLIGHLRKSFRIQKRRIRESVSRVDPLSRTLRQHNTSIPRGTYEVPCANALWHVDGHHKLILWGIVIHGIVDGRTRAITGIRAADNNRALTVLAVLLRAIAEWGMPSRMRGDRGLENRLIALYMIIRMGLNRGSFLFGSSTHNTRIERLWVEVGAWFVRHWRAFFFRLERLHGLKRHDPAHLWLLHYLFLDEINAACEQFQEEYNQHPISGAGHDDSPLDMYLLDVIGPEGVHAPPTDEFTHVDPDLLQEHYGTRGNPKTRVTGMAAGHDEFDEDGLPPDDQLSDDIDAFDDLQGFPEEPQEEGQESFWRSLLTSLRDKFLPQPVKIPRKSCPFDDEDLQLFESLLTTQEAAKHVPPHYGLQQSEWNGSEYPTYEILRSGRKRTKELQIALPVEVWLPRAERWGRALHVMTTLQAYNSET